RTNFILVMADDQGWGQTGYYDHPVLKTPHLDEMAGNGLRFDRFYAGGPVCSPTRASVLTGRTHDRTGVFDHGYALRKQEKTLPEALKKAGYATGHFGKWHLNGLRGPGVPILPGDSNGPKGFGFDHWLSVTNFFDLNPVMSRQGKFEDFKGDSSEIIVDEALKFMDKQVKADKPFFCVIWYGTPHSPWMALEKDLQEFDQLEGNSRAHYAELRAMDRSIGTLRAGLRKMNVDKDTLVWFTSDNGGLPKIKPTSTGGLRDFKGSLYEGGIRVPAIIEWPKGINKFRTTKFPAGAVDIFPTIAEIAGLPDTSMHQPQDGQSLVQLMKKDVGPRDNPLIFRSRARMAVIDNNWKIISQPRGDKRKIELFNLAKDSSESDDLFHPQHEQVTRLRKTLVSARTSIDRSVQGKDYPEGKVLPQPPRIFWTEVPAYKKYFKAWKDRPEYESRLRKTK
ncbi:MAG: sulfatase-like hydrolase/transferase, partial [Verrucomicrobiota bacterium]|nr:sulfatase-like hydrolase/transferase [Verrucomicrobiota bacterium]